MVHGSGFLTLIVERESRSLLGVEAVRSEAGVDLNAFNGLVIIDDEDMEQPDVAAWVPQRLVMERENVDSARPCSVTRRPWLDVLYSASLPRYSAFKCLGTPNDVSR